MAGATLKRLFTRLSGPVVLSALLAVSLGMMTAAIQNSELFGNLYSLLLLINVVAVSLLTALIVLSIVRLVRQFRARALGSRLTLRLFGLFVLLSVVPVLVVYGFSLQAFNRGIDNWFDVRVEEALDSALALGSATLEVARQDLTRKANLLATGLRGPLPAETALTALRSKYQLLEITLFTADGQMLVSSQPRRRATIPSPPATVLAQLRRGEPHHSIEPLGDDGLQLRVLVPLSPSTLLQVVEALPERHAQLSRNVQNAFDEYKKLFYLRGPLKFGFLLSLSLIALSTLLLAVWVAIQAARRMVEPIRDLAEGTTAVAQGDYSKQLPVTSDDEIGILVDSFNHMTRRIRRAQGEIQRGQREAEANRTYLETVLTHLSSGVLSFDARGNLRTYNNAAGQILGHDLAPGTGQSLAWLAAADPALAPLVRQLDEFMTAPQPEWQTELMLPGTQGRRTLIVRGTRLPGLRGRHGGMVVVFDDVTALIQAQRNAAWGEVARRLAHEIKNPLTPIQLSAERIRHKCMDPLPEKERAMLDRATHTIVQQVEAMKAMVNAFSDYARPAPLNLETVALNQLVHDVVELYKGRANPVRYELDLDASLPALSADTGRLRQVLHNLLANAADALAGSAEPTLRISTRHVAETGGHWAELVLRDNGPGFAEPVMDKLFEPYVTTKDKGTGLGLAIVKKIVEEHHGQLRVGNHELGGAVITLRLPAAASTTRAREAKA